MLPPNFGTVCPCSLSDIIQIISHEKCLQDCWFWFPKIVLGSAGPVAQSSEGKQSEAKETCSEAVPAQRYTEEVIIHPWVEQ